MDSMETTATIAPGGRAVKPAADSPVKPIPLRPFGRWPRPTSPAPPVAARARALDPRDPADGAEFYLRIMDASVRAPLGLPTPLAKLGMAMEDLGLGGRFELFCELGVGLVVAFFVAGGLAALPVDLREELETIRRGAPREAVGRR
jgi:hypothetical protein